jgi:hypothetical protein
VLQHNKQQLALPLLLLLLDCMGRLEQQQGTWIPVQ